MLTNALTKFQLLALLATSPIVLSQLAQVPAQCQTVCNPVNTLIASTCTVAKCCNSGFANGYVDCATCFGGTTGQTDYAQNQAFFDTLFATCSRGGQPIPKLTLPGQNADRTIAGAGASSASPAPGSGEAPPRSSPPASGGTAGRPPDTGTRAPPPRSPQNSGATPGSPSTPSGPGSAPNGGPSGAGGGPTMTMPPSSSLSGPGNGTSPNMTSGPPIPGGGSRNWARSSVSIPSDSVYVALAAGVVTIVGASLFVF